MVLNLSAFQTTKKNSSNTFASLDELKKVYPGGDFGAKIEKPLNLDAFKDVSVGETIRNQQKAMEQTQPNFRTPFAKAPNVSISQEPTNVLIKTLVSRTPELLVSLPVAIVNFFRKNINTIVQGKPVETEQFKNILGFDPKRFGIDDKAMKDTFASAVTKWEELEKTSPNDKFNIPKAVATTIIPDVLDVLFGYDVLASEIKLAVGGLKLSFRQLPESILFKIQEQKISPQAIRDALVGSELASPAERKIATDFIMGLSQKERAELFRIAKTYEVTGTKVPIQTGVEQTAIGKFAGVKLPELPKLPPQQVALLNSGKLNLQAGFLDVNAISNDIKTLAQKANSVPELQKLLSPKQLAELTAKGIGIEALYNAIKPQAQKATSVALENKIKGEIQPTKKINSLIDNYVSGEKESKRIADMQYRMTPDEIEKTNREINNIDIGNQSVVRQIAKELNITEYEAINALSEYIDIGARRGKATYSDFYNYFRTPELETKISPNLQSLAEEAKKYKSVEEFVNSMEEIGNRKINIPAGYQGGKTQIEKIQDELKQFRIKAKEISVEDTKIAFDKAKAEGKSWAKGRNFDNPDVFMRAQLEATPKGIDINAGKLDKSQLTDIYNQATKKALPEGGEDFSEIPPLTAEQEDEVRKIYEAEFENIKNDYKKQLRQDIGSISISQNLREEMSDLPISILNNKTQNNRPDQVVERLKEKGYNIDSESELFDLVRDNFGSMPSRYKVQKKGLLSKLDEIRKIKTKSPERIAKEAEALERKIIREANKIVKESTVGRNLPPKKVIEQTIGLKQPPETKEFTQKQLLRKEEIIAKRAGTSAVKQYRKQQAFLENLNREITIELNKPKGKQRSVIAFIKKLGEFNQTVINEIKGELGIEGSIREMNLTELNNFVSKIKERLRFKFEHGYRPSAETKATLKLKETPKPELTEDDYIANRELSKTKDGGFIKSFIKSGKNIKQTAGKILTPISTRLENIDPTLKYALRKFEFDATNSVQKDKLAIKPFLQVIKKLKKEDLSDFDLALKNGDSKKITEIAKKYGIEKELGTVRITLDNIYKEANKVGFDIGYQKDYFPRMIKDTEGFLEYFDKQDYWSILDEAIKRKEMDLGRYLIQEEKAELINQMIRGYQSGQITLSGTGSMKERVIDLVTPELNKFYYNTPTSLLKYIESVDDKIAARKFFGKSNKIDGYNNIEDSIGTYTADLLAKGKITPKQELEIRDMLNARFNPKGTHGIVGLYKNLAYIDVMGSFLNAVTQLGDQAWSIYRSGIWKTIKSDIKSVLGKSKITKETLGLEAGNIVQEFSDTGKIAKTLDKVFTLTGLNKMDRLGKQALVNGAIEKYQKMAENPKIDFLKKLDEIFGKESEQILEALKSGEITENVKLLAFNELLDFHPVSLSEMPEQYLKGGNGRILYMLKSYTLKQFDIFRREAFREMKRGNWLKGIRNLLYLSTLVILVNGTADEIKDLLTNRKTKLSDRVIDQIAMLVGFSRYNLGKISEVGLGSALLDQVTPPMNFIDNISKDLMNLYKDFDESANINKLRTIQDIPLIGKFYYWWFGKGAETQKKLEKKESSGLPSLPKLPKLPELPKLPKIPQLSL